MKLNCIQLDSDFWIRFGQFAEHPADSRSVVLLTEAFLVRLNSIEENYANKLWMEKENRSCKKKIAKS